MSTPSPLNVPASTIGDRIVAHGSAVAYRGCGVMMVGPSGSGKSALALELMAFGATLIADDRVEVQQGADRVILSPPAEIAGRIEARHVGLMTAEYTRAPLALVIDMAVEETERLPHPRSAVLAGREVPLLQKVASGHFVAAILLYLKGKDTA